MAKLRRRESIGPALRSDTSAPQFDTTAANGDRERIAEKAYELYVSRGGGDGRDLDDWIEAERDLARRRGHGHRDDMGPDPAA
jgi:hypothetical protein